jgi:DNA-binding response OmpR family regulator
VITGSRDWELNRMGLRTGLFLRKPFKRKELLVMICALLGEELDEQPEAGMSASPFSSENV